MSLEGKRPWHVQIKSRVKYCNRSPVGEASRHMLKRWQKRSELVASNLRTVVAELSDANATTNYGSRARGSLPQGNGQVSGRAEQPVSGGDRRTVRSGQERGSLDLRLCGHFVPSKCPTQKGGLRRVT